VRRLFQVAAATAGAGLAVAAALFLSPVIGARRRAAARAAVRRESANVAALVGEVIDRRPRRPWRRPSTTAVAGRARLALEASFGDAARAIQVREGAGVVTLRGEVEEMGDIARYEAAVRALPGVVDVDNLIRLRVYGVTRPSAVTA
jgi:hypothetical protein